MRILAVIVGSLFYLMLFIFVSVILIRRLKGQIHGERKIKTRLVLVGITLIASAMFLSAWMVADPTIMVSMSFLIWLGDILFLPFITLLVGMSFIKRAKRIDFDDSMPAYKLAENPPVIVPAKQLTEHVRVLASTGAGKTKSVLSNLLVQGIRKGQFVLVIDPKGDDEVIQVAIDELNKQGRLDDFYYFDITKPELSRSYNPLLNGTPNQIAARVLATMPKTGTKNAFFEEKQKEFLRAIMKGIADIMKLTRETAKREGKTINFIDLYSMVSFAPLSLEYLKERFSDRKGQIDRLSQMLQYWIQGMLYESKSSKRYREFLTGLAQHLSKYAFGLENSYLINDYAPGIDLYEAMRNGKVVYFSLRALAYPEGEALDIGRMVLMDLQSVAAWRQENSIDSELPVLVLIDEASQVVPPEFLSTMEMARSAGISVVLIHQAREQFREDLSARIDQNTAIKIIMNIQEPQTAEHYANTVGQQLTMFRHIAESGENFLREMKGYLFPGWSYAYREQYDYIVRPEEFMRLQKGEAFIIYKGEVVKAKLPFVAANLRSPLEFQLPHFKREKDLYHDRKGLRLHKKLLQYVEERKRQGKEALTLGDVISGVEIK